MRSILFLLFVSLAFNTQCRWRVTKDSIKHGEKLKASIESFEDNRQKLAVKVVESLEDAHDKLNNESPNLPRISKDWEVEWTKVHNRYKKLKDDFEKTGSNSKAYFDRLDELSNNINNEELRRSELSKNTELKKKWSITYDKASSAIQKVTNVLQAGNDFHMVLVASSIRQKLEQNVQELETIAQQAKVLLADLEEFTIAGRALVEG